MSTIEQYGRFNEGEGYFEITAEPPRKWRNILYNQVGPEEYYAEATHIGDGMSRYRDARGNTVNVLGYDCKYLYIRDDETNEVFNPAGMPVPTPVRDRVIRIYPSKTEIVSVCADLRVSARYFVPKSELLEAWTVKIENLSNRPRKISVFAYAMFALHGSDHEDRGFWKDTYSEIHAELGGTLVFNRLHHLPLKKMNGFLVALNHFHAANGYRDHFTHADYSLGAPRILSGWNCNNTGDYGPDCAGVVQCTLTIPAGGQDRVDYLAGPCVDAVEVRGIRGRLSPARLDLLDQEQMDAEKKRASAFTISTGDVNRDGLFNIFVKKQIYSYLVDKGGVRDNLQNDNAVALFDPATARANILKTLSVHQADGSSLHSWRPLNRHHYSDKPFYMLQSVPWYIKESGDFDLLEETVPFFESTETGTVWEHLKRSYRHLSRDVGRRGLCLQHHADWNDQLEPSAKTGERESVMVSEQLCAGLLEMAELADRVGDLGVGEECRALHREMAEKINHVAWDGAWYQRTICEDGYALGSGRNEEAKIFVNTQSWAVLGCVAEEERLRQCMESVDRHLTKPEGIPICDPPCTKFDERIGRFTTVMPYHIENGGCYNHAAGFKTVADCILGRAEQAWDTLVKVAPDNPDNPVSQSWVEPFSFTNFYTRVPMIRGRSGYAWRTGTAAWFTVALVEWILGARRSYDGLLIDPCLTRRIPLARIRRTFRGAIYDIELDNSAGRCRGVRKLVVNGKEIVGNTIPAFRDGCHAIHVTI